MTYWTYNDYLILDASPIYVSNSIWKKKKFVSKLGFEPTPTIGLG